MRQLRDARAAEQTERGQAALALDDGVQAERIAGLELQLALDRLRARARVADDQDVIDEDLRALAHREHDVGACGRRRSGPASLSTVAFWKPRLAYFGWMASRSIASCVAKNGAGLQPEPRRQLDLRHRRVALDADRFDDRPGVLDDHDADAQAPRRRSPAPLAIRSTDASTSADAKPRRR